MPRFAYQTVTIASGQTTSNAVAMARNTLVGIRIPAAFTGTSITVQEAETVAGTFSTVNPNGAGASYPVTVSNTIAIQPSNIACAEAIKIVSSSSEAADRVITIISRDID